MELARTTQPCPICGTEERPEILAEAGWISRDTEYRIRATNRQWRRADGACPACVQEALLSLLLERGEAILGQVIQRVWPMDSEAAFGALPTPLRLRADPRFTGHGVTIAMIDAGFFPHADLIHPDNRIRAWVDVGAEEVVERRFTPNDVPTWPGADEREPPQWHGLMTSAAAAGNGWMSHGLYRGMSPDADLVLVQARGSDGRVGSRRIVRALTWILRYHREFGIRVVNISLGGEAASPLAGNEVDAAVAALAAEGITVVAAAGNDGVRQLVPPATAPTALTVGGLDDHNVFDAAARALWRSNYGVSGDGSDKPELVAPSIWVVAPLLPGTDVATEAVALFARRAAGDQSGEDRIGEQRLVTPHYQHVEGTSFAAPIVSGVVACMLEANPRLDPHRIRALLEGACTRIAGAPAAHQGAGALDAGRAVALAVAATRGTSAEGVRSPMLESRVARFRLLDFGARTVRVLGSWNDWQKPGALARLVEPGVWEASVGPLDPGTHAYKFLLDDDRWIADPSNAMRTSDGVGGWNSVLGVDPSISSSVPPDATARHTPSTLTKFRPGTSRHSYHD